MNDGIISIPMIPSSSRFVAHPTSFCNSNQLLNITLEHMYFPNGIVDRREKRITVLVEYLICRSFLWQCHSHLRNEIVNSFQTRSNNTPCASVLVPLCQQHTKLAKKTINQIKSSNSND
eukprot:m.106989 g.106989  ORF g.106989 m.106989 type:complete len:119 (+) comp12683_c4_seq1:843-1199(+)